MTMHSRDESRVPPLVRWRPRRGPGRREREEEAW